MGKNINQDKTLAIQRYVEGYHELVSQMAIHLEKHQPEDHDNHGDHEEVLQYSAKQGEISSDFEIIERLMCFKSFEWYSWVSISKPKNRLLCKYILKG